MKYRPRRIAPSVPTASMADIAFLLIIFFMLTTSFSPERTSVELPESEYQTEVSDESAIIAITNEGELKFTDGEVPSYDVENAQALGVIIESLVELAPEKEFLIKADRQVSYRYIDEVLEELRLRGARRIGLLTRRRPVTTEEEEQQEEPQAQPPPGESP